MFEDDINFDHKIIKKPNLYIIAGCNGAGKTTASEVILPELLNCYEFVNADNIARGLSPFNVEKVAFEAGRIMIHRIHELLQQQEDFAVETTLSSKMYQQIIQESRTFKYRVKLLYVWLESPEMAVDRVALRVKQGGHHIPADVVHRRYTRGLQNLFSLYLPIVDSWTIVNNSSSFYDQIAQGQKTVVSKIENQYLWNFLNIRYGSTQ